MRCACTGEAGAAKLWLRGGRKEDVDIETAFRKMSEEYDLQHAGIDMQTA
jgi:hypothetical protein